MITIKERALDYSRNKPIEVEKFITKARVMEMLNVTRVTLWRWEKQGILKSVSIGKKQYYCLADIHFIFSNIRSNQKAKFSESEQEIKDYLSNAITSMRSDNSFSLLTLKKALEERFELYSDGAKMSHFLGLNDSQDWNNKMGLVYSCLQTLGSLVDEISLVVEDAKEQEGELELC